MANFLAAARRAIWKSIAGHKPLEGEGKDGSVFRPGGVFLWDDDQATVRWTRNFPPPSALMPAISIRTGPEGNPHWETHSQQLVDQFVEIRVWTQFHNQERAEQMWQSIWEAIQQVPTVTRPYLKDVTGVRPIRVTFPTIEFIETDVRATAWDDEGNVTETIGNACTETRFAVVVDHRRDPRNV